MLGAAIRCGNAHNNNVSSNVEDNAMPTMQCTQIVIVLTAEELENCPKRWGNSSELVSIKGLAWTNRSSMKLCHYVFPDNQSN